MKNLLFIIIAISIVLPKAALTQSGKWFTGVSDSGDAYYASTINESGNLLGQYCFPVEGNCFWLVGLNTACKEGAKYPILVNSDTGAAHMTMYCSAQLKSGLYRYIITEFDAMNTVVTKSIRIGFALPLQSDQFRVIRFDLSGSNSAISQMINAAKQAQGRSSSGTAGTKDQDL
jgi:hypothetical protein